MRREKIFCEAVGESGEKILPEERKKERERGAVEKDADLIPRLVLHEQLLFLSVTLEEDIAREFSLPSTRSRHPRRVLVEIKNINAPRLGTRSL